MFIHILKSYKRHYLIQARHRKSKGEKHNESRKVNSLTATQTRKMEKEAGEHPGFKITKRNIHKGGVFIIVLESLRRTKLVKNKCLLQPKYILIKSSNIRESNFIQKKGRVSSNVTCWVVVNILFQRTPLSCQRPKLGTSQSIYGKALRLIS